MRSSWAIGVLALGVWSGCTDPKERVAKQERALEAARAAELKKKTAAAPEPQAEEKVTLDSFWDDPEYLSMAPDGACPEGIWALFPGPPPGEGLEQKKNAARRTALARALKEATVLVKLRAPTHVKLGEYNAPKGHFPLELVGTIDCTDSAGHVAIAWTKATAVAPAASAAKQGAEVTQNIWQAQPMSFTLPMSSMSEAKAWQEKNRFGLEARLILKLETVAVDKKVFKTTKVKSGEVTIGGGAEDWGAGRLVRATVVGLRISTDRERKELIAQRP